MSLAPGVHHDIPAAEYHALPAVSSTFLKRFRSCPAGALLPFESTPAMTLGTAIHAFSLEGRAAFERDFAVLFTSDLNKNTTIYKGQRAEFELANRGKTILPSDYDKVPTVEILEGVDASLRAHPMAGRILAQGRQELSLVWDDAATGLRCKARLDHDPGRGAIVDLKTTADAGAFVRQLVSLSYDVQSGHYSTGSDVLLGGVDTFVFVVVEPAPPYTVRCGFLAPDWLAWAKLEAARLLGLVKECRERECWPAYKIPQNTYSLSDLQPSDLLEEWSMPSYR